MKRILMAIMAVAVAVTFSAPAFAGDPPPPPPTTTKDSKKDDKKGGYTDTFAGPDDKTAPAPAPKPTDKGK